MRQAKLFVLFCIASLFAANAFASYGDWKIYASYGNATKVAELNNVIYVVSNNGLYSYGIDDTSVETYNKAETLSDNDIFDIISCEKTKQVVIVYSNGNVDLLDTKGNVYNMPELKDKNLNDKTLNQLYVYEENIYISTNSGIVVLDTKRKVFANFFYFGEKVAGITIDNGYIVAVTEGGTYKGKLTDNLLDSNKWQRISTQYFTRIVQFGNDYYFTNRYNRLFRTTNKDTFAWKQISDVVITEMCVVGDRIFVFTADDIYVYDKDQNETKIPNPDYKSLLAKGNTYWVAAGTEGLKGMSFDGKEFTQKVSSIIPDGPIRNYFFRMKMMDNGRLLVAGGAFNYPDVKWTGTIMKYEDGKWTTFDEEGPINDVGDYYYNNICDILQDPDDSEHHYASAASSGIYEFKDYKYVNHITRTNSPLTSILPNSSHVNNYVRITGLALDKHKNLWMLNTEVDTIVRVMKPDKTWDSYYFPEIAKSPTFDQIVFDERGWAWINCRRTLNDRVAGVLVLDNNGTLENKSDDDYRFCSYVTNQDGTSYSFNYVNCLLEDLNGAMWIGTNKGPFVLYDPRTVFDEKPIFYQVKVPRNDGTNYADYLLADIEVKCMAIDGGNRKWFGTVGNGVYLVSADGTEILEHFTTENSPLLSDEIYSIAIDGRTGEVFIGTTKGLVSYMSNATNPDEEFDKDLVKVYPNPIRPDYTGDIIIKGLMADSRVKIVNAAGRLVHEGISVGGEFTWNGKLNGGKKAASGVYYVLATDSEGDKGVATKFLIVR